MKLVSILFCFCVMTSPLICDQAPMPSQEEQDGHIIVNNRILAKVMGKTISVIDVMKKMDVFIDRYYPQFSHAQRAKHQFYTTHWQAVLTQMIDTELMLADAEGREITATDAEVRETLQERFGPHIMPNLSKVGITYEEAKKMIHSELIVQKMNWLRVHSKALQQVNSQDVKIAYEEFCKKNPATEEWKYQVLSIRANDEDHAKLLAKTAYDLLAKGKSDFNCVAEELKQKNDATDLGVAVTVSEEYQVKNHEISLPHKEALASLDQSQYSQPLRQLSRFDNSSVMRIFYLKDHAVITPSSLQTMAAQLKEQLIEEAVSKETTAYLSKLRKRFGFDQNYWQNLVPANFQPFIME